MSENNNDSGAEDEEFDEEAATRPLNLPTMNLNVARDPTITKEIVVRSPDASQSVKIMSADLAQAFRMEHEPTVREENSFNFNATLDADGNIPVPERFKGPGTFEAGVKVVVSVSIERKRV